MAKLQNYCIDVNFISFEYWRDLQAKGYVIVSVWFLTPKRDFDVGIIEGEDESLLTEFERNDPALKVGNTYEGYPMRTVRNRQFKYSPFFSCSVK